MNKLFLNRAFALLFALGLSNMCADQMSGALIREEADPDGGFDISTIYYTSDMASYLNGGLTFTYPAYLFGDAPHVTVGLEPLISLGSNQSLAHEVTSNSAGSTTIVVKIVTQTLLDQTTVEASDGDVNVHIFAVAIGQ